MRRREGGTETWVMVEVGREQVWEEPGGEEPAGESV